MRVIVTGSNGYIGTILVPMLVERGHEVRGIDTDLYEACTFGDSFPKIDYVRKDIRDLQAADLRGGYDALLDLSGLSNDPLGNLNPKLTDEINFRAVVRCAELAKEVGIPRYIFSSSCSTYGAAGENMVNEEAQFNPVTPYGLAKVHAERELAKLASDEFTPTYLRNATAYGVSPRIRFDLVLNNLTAWAYTTGLVYLKSDGTPWRPIVHIEDISRAFVAVLEAPREVVHNQAFNVGINSENYQIRELAEFVKEIVPNTRIEYAEDAGPDKRCYRVDCSKLPRMVPSFKPVWTARKGVEEIYAAIDGSGLTLEEFEGPRYQRIGHIKQLIASGKLNDELRWNHK